MKFYEKFVVNILKQGSVPNHIAFIMDGNRRSATKKGLKKSKGHELGFESLKRCLEWCLNLGVKIVTVYAFSLDNFKRDKEEVDTIMRLAKEKLLEIAQENEFLARHSIKVKFCGDLARLQPDVRESLEKVEQLTGKYNSLLLNICFSYDSQFEIDTGVKTFLKNEDVSKYSTKNQKELAKVHQKFKEYLFVKDDVDLLVRTSNEIRLSDFLIFQSAISELCFIKECWPDITIISFLKMILQYQLNEKTIKAFRASIKQINGI
mmetsp:Transcript_70491/g.82122  ORF Transcript_70491/g.82122 Transcript_70491/m.82122 type:complete len:263 (-) Transcript_70491:95-883(-)